MINILKKIFGKILIYLTPKNNIGSIWLGPLRGYLWNYDKNYNRYWIWTHEKEITSKFTKYANISSVIYDLGASYGFYTLLSSKHVKSEGIVYSFEPNINLVKKIKKHIKINSLKNVKILNYAVSNNNEKIKFSLSDQTTRNSIIKSSRIFNNNNFTLVDSVKIDSLIEKGEIKIPDLLKIDIEGAELKALEGMKNTLFKYHPTIFLSTHNCHLEGIHKKCCDFLKTLNYEIKYLNYFKKITEFDDPWYDIIAEYEK